MAPEIFFHHLACRKTLISVLATETIASDQRYPPREMLKFVRKPRLRRTHVRCGTVRTKFDDPGIKPSDLLALCAMRGASFKQHTESGS